MKENISNISPVTPEHLREFYVLDSLISKAVESAKSSGVPQGLIVAVLHSYATRETLELI